MRKIFAAFVLSLSLFLPVQAQEGKIITLTPIEICGQFVQIGYNVIRNYYLAGADKEAQLKYLREKVFPQSSMLALFEPGIIKTLNAMMKGREYLDSVEEQQYHEVAVKFAISVGDACMADGVQGWIIGTKDPTN